jgi:hypothetical protein
MPEADFLLEYRLYQPYRFTMQADASADRVRENDQACGWPA